MKHTQTKKRGISPQTFNMLIFAAILVLAILITVIIHSISLSFEEKQEEDKQATVNGAGQAPTTTYHLDNPYAGVLSFCSPATPWTEAQVDAVFSTLIPLKSFSFYEEEPYLLQTESLLAKAETVMALRKLSQGLCETGITATPVVTEAYMPYTEAEAAGKTDLHTGYALTLSLKITLNGAEGVLPLTDSNPVVASASLWLSTHAHEYGFIIPNADNPGHLLYVSPPHATAMKDLGIAPTTYLALLHSYTQSSPLVVTGAGHTWQIFYLSANHGTATLTLPQNTAYAVTGDGIDGFVITTFASPA